MMKLQTNVHFIVVIYFQCLISIVDCGVIPPPWADVQLNPCAKYSWQYLHWNEDGQCYPIFQQGPCPETQELIFDTKTKTSKCQCSSHKVYWEDDQRCYEPYTRGPCPENSFLHPGKEMIHRGHRTEPHRRTLLQLQNWRLRSESSALEPLGFIHCKQRGWCPPKWAFWPQTEQCYPLYSQGPCHNGNIFYINSETRMASCGCNDDQLTEFYWPISATCHERFSQGPCKLGEVFFYNKTSKTTQCTCSRELNNYHEETNQCYEKFTRGPCRPGQWLASTNNELPQYSVPAQMRWRGNKTWTDGQEWMVKKSSLGPSRCFCLPGHVFYAKDGHCYREYTRGSCQADQFIVKNPSKDSGICIRNPCSRNELYFPEVERCFKIHSRGPCDEGQIVIADDYHGISYRGHCGCSFIHVQNYWPADGKCYEHETRGPCPTHFVFTTRSSHGVHPQCSCPEDHIYFNETRRCYRPFSQGPCEWNEWLVPKYDSSNDVSATSHDESIVQEYICRCKPGYEYQTGSTFCKPPTMELLLSLQKPSRSKREQLTPSKYRSPSPMNASNRPQ